MSILKVEVLSFEMSPSLLSHNFFLQNYNTNLKICQLVICAKFNWHWNILLSSAENTPQLTKYKSFPDWQLKNKEAILKLIRSKTV